MTLPLDAAPLPVTVSVKVSVSSSAGAVKLGRTVAAPLPVSYVTAVPADWDQEGVVARIGCQVLTQAFATTTDMLNAA